MANIITESLLCSIIAESIKSILNEMGLPPDQIGASGSLPTKPVSELIANIPQNIWNMMDSGDKAIPYNKIEKYFGGCKAYEVYKLYEEAITGPYKAYQLRLQNWNTSHPGEPFKGKVVEERKAVSFFTFLNRLRRGWKGCPMYYFEFNGSYVLGTMLDGVFLVIYFCPTASAKFSVIEEMCKYNNVVFSVTEDMSRILDMMGLRKSENKVDCKFRGEFHQKDVYATSDDALQKGIKIIGLTNGDKITAATEIAKMQQKNPNSNEIQQDSIMNIITNPHIEQIVKNNPQIVNYFKNNPEILKDVLQHKDIFINMLNNPMFQFVLNKHPEKIEELIGEILNGFRSEK